MMEKIEAFLNRFIAPVANKMSNSDLLQAIAEGFMRTGPITFGVFIFAILSNIPVGGYNEWIAAVGLKPQFDAVMNAGLNILSLYVSFTIAYAYAKRKKTNPMSAGLLSLMSFLIIIPQTVAGKDGDVTAFNLNYLGGNGVLCALVIALCVSGLFVFLSKKNLTFKMPAGVPPMVSESLEPMFIAMIISALAFCLRFGFAMTPFGNFIDFFQQTIGGVLTGIGLSVPMIIGLVFVANVIWFFGIHPNTVYSAFTPLAMILMMTNIQDYAAGQPMTYFVPSMVYLFAGFGGNGNTLGLCLSMFTAKSERYKKMFKLSFVPNLFNINEPLIFGMPVMMNPTFFIPMTCSCLVMGILGYFAATLIPFAWNPSMSLLPFTVPFFVKAVLGNGGVTVLLIMLGLLVVNTLIYFPFFKMADKQALEEEQAAKAAAEADAATEKIGA